VREIEDAGAISDAVVQTADAVDVLLVVGAGGDDVVGAEAEDIGDGFVDGADDGRRLVGHGGRDGPQIAQLVAEAGAGGFQLFEQVDDFAADGFGLFFDKVTAVDDDAGRVRDDRRRKAGVARFGLGLAAMDRIDVEGGLAGVSIARVEMT